MSTVPIPKILANFETSLAATMSASATTLTLNRSTDADGSTLSGLYSLTFDEGTTSEEHMTVTLTGASGVVSRRGQSRVDGFTEVSGNKYRHERGASVKITSFALLNIQRLLNGTDTFDAVDWAGINSITGLATPTSGETTKAANVAYVNAVSIAGGSNASTTQQGFVEASTTSENTSGASVGGTGALLFSTPAQIAAQIQSNSWLYAVEDGTGSDDTYTWAFTPAITAYTTGMMMLIKFTVANTGACTGNANTLGAKTIKKYVAGALADLETGDIVANMSGMLYYDGTYLVLLNATATMPTTALLQEMSDFFSTTAITGAQATTLVGGGNASSLHTHAIAILSGQRAQNAASGSQTFAHGLSTTPKYIEVTVTTTGFDAATAGVFDGILSHGYSDGSVHKCVYHGANANGASDAVPTAGLDTSNCVRVACDDAGTTNVLQVATASFDSTNVTLTWTLTGTGTATNMNIVIIAHT